MFRNLKTLLSVTEAVALDQTGTRYAILPSEEDGVADHQVSWRAFIDVAQAGGETAPTTDVALETSHDATSWVNICSATQLTGDGAGHEFKEITAIGPFVRARTILGGGTKPNHTVTVKLACNASFALHPMS